ncbi:hypothetical protein [Anaerococcus sp. AGMB09787]|nr:hypothetical protein [Anaerococcus sp. AGMB09787]
MTEKEKKKLDKISEKSYLNYSQIVRRGIDKQYQEFFSEEKGVQNGL